MTSHVDSQTTTDVKPDMLSSVQTGNGIPYDKYDIHGIAHACTYRKDNIFMQRGLVKSFTYTELILHAFGHFIGLMTTKLI